MFCISCGTNNCSKYGVFLSNPTSESSSKIMGLKEFKKERNGAIDPISAKEIAEGEQVEGQGNRSVNTGFMELEASGNLKRCRGKTLPVKV